MTALNADFVVGSWLQSASRGRLPQRCGALLSVTSSPGASILNIIRTSLKSAGYEDGNNLDIDFREANGHYGTLPVLVGELIALNPDLMIAEATPAVAAAQKATTKIPIIMAPASDPIGAGYS